MKIKNISCTQFAGVRDRAISFEDGINVVYGNNESGKSTLVNLISRTLFQKARLDRRSDKEFQDLYFPGARKGNLPSGDFADGKISFETKDGIYVLSKEWGAESRCMLATPDGVIRDQGEIQAVLKDVLLYGEGVYSDLLFTSQRGRDLFLQTILDASKKTEAKREIADVVSQAFAESDGISLDAIESAIYAKMDEIAGRHWDFEKDMPVRKAGRWASGLGGILKAYYAMEDAKAVLAEISRLEEESDRVSNDYAVKDAAFHMAEDAYNQFHTFAGQLAVRSERKKNISRIDKELLKAKEVISSWPELVEALEKAKVLQTEKEKRGLLDQYEAAKEAADELENLKSQAANTPSPADNEIVRVKTAQRTMESFTNKLCGMNLNASLKVFGDHKVIIKSLRTGGRIDAADGSLSITEAVNIMVPGVMEIQLSPADVDVQEISAAIADQKKIADTIFERYNVSTVMELEQLAKRTADMRAKIQAADNRLSLLLGNTVSFEELEAAAKAVTGTVRNREEIEKEIASICGDQDVIRYVASKETVIDGYIAEYGSIEELQAKACHLEAELKKAEESASAIENIPAKFLGIADPEAHLDLLKRELEKKRNRREEVLKEKTAAASRLESYKENISGDPVTEAEKAERGFEEQRELLAHWKHIAEVFRERKESIHDNPMQDIADRFTYYLGVISGGRVSSEFPEADKLNMNIYSDNRLLDYGKLSEGTKDTVSLAFRLAVLDHLFPEGGGVIVFDDPFTDMDAGRTARSCELLKACAVRHQVIFLTCREEYLAMLEGKRIFVS